MADIYWLSGSTGIGINPVIAKTKAQDAIQNAIRIDESLAETYVASGLINLYMNWDLSEANKDFTKAEQLNPNSPQVYNGWTDYYMIIGQVDKALENAENAMELDPLFSEYLHHVGGLYCALGRYDDAMKLIKRTERLDPDNIYSYLIQSWYHGYQGNYKEIIEISEEALENGRFEKIQVQFRLGYWYGLLGEYEKAKHILNEMLDFKKKIPVINLHSNYLCRTW